LKVGGVCWIAEVRSRFDGSKGVASIESFTEAANALGFKLQGTVDARNKMFFVLRLVKSAARRPKKVHWPPLKACTYKRR
jgi:ribosomal RNA-processing protein 8